MSSFQTNVFIQTNKVNQRIFFIFRDNVSWTDEQKLEAEKVIEKNSAVKFTNVEIQKLEEVQWENWDKFYGVHQNKFFKDRHWLFTGISQECPCNFISLMTFCIQQNSLNLHQKQKPPREFILKVMKSL